MEPSRWALDPFLKQPIKTFENTQEAIPSQALYGSREGQTTPYGFDSGAQGQAETVSPGPNR